MKRILKLLLPITGILVTIIAGIYILNTLEREDTAPEEAAAGQGDPYDIFLVAGQSNTHHGIGYNPELDNPGAKIYQFDRYDRDDDISTIILPASEPLQSLSYFISTDRIGFAVPVAKLWRDNGDLESGREIIILHGGKAATSFSDGHWGRDGNLTNNLVSKTNQLTEAYPNSRIIALLWHQGESDTETMEQRQEYEQEWLDMINRLEQDIEYFSEDTPVLIGQMAPSWITNPEVYPSFPVSNRIAVDAAHQNLPNLRDNTLFVSAEEPSEIGREDDQPIGEPDDPIHYSAPSQRLLGERYYHQLIMLTIDSIRSSFDAHHNAEFVSQSVPSSVSAGSNFQATLTFKNIGDITWEEGEYSLGSENPHENTTWGKSSVMLERSVEPDQTVTVTFTATAPQIEDNYDFQWQLFKNDVTSFGSVSENVRIGVFEESGETCTGGATEGETRSCGSDVGACTKGIQTCTGGVWGDCFGGISPAAETCDNVDNDCDGVTDENLSRTCGTAAGICTTGIETCSNGKWLDCTGVRPNTEICDGLDNDCDGRIDEGCSCESGSKQKCGSEIGACAMGTQSCEGNGQWGACYGDVGPKTEICDSLDNDCDGMVDENVSRSCGVDIGECEQGTQRCANGEWEICDGMIEAVPEICDEKDNDCDGTVDEGCSCDAGQIRDCGSDFGECQQGRQKCESGFWTDCENSIAPVEEICDEKDNDCDGSIDEGYVCEEQEGTEEGGFAEEVDVRSEKGFKIDENLDIVIPILVLAFVTVGAGGVIIYLVRRSRKNKQLEEFQKGTTTTTDSEQTPRSPIG